jgi:uncharacterized membrane protein
MRPICLLLLVPYVVLLCVPIYNLDLPHLFGLPFFYWFQLLWIPITALIIYIVFTKVRDEG